ncbi:MAG: hypothetical protein ABR564_01745, partial [Candidatus Dormibacteria bacterium]
DLMGQMGGLQEKLAGDPKLQEMMSGLVQRIQEDLGGPEEMERMIGGLFGPGGFPGTGPRGTQGDVPPEDRPADDRTPPTTEP